MVSKLAEKSPPSAQGIDVARNSSTVDYTHQIINSLDQVSKRLYTFRESLIGPRYDDEASDTVSKLPEGIMPTLRCRLLDAEKILANINTDLLALEDEFNLGKQTTKG